MQIAFLHTLNLLSATESKAELKASLWKLPSDFEDAHPEDQSSHQSLALVCHLEAADYGDMKRYYVTRTLLHFLVSLEDSLSFFYWSCLTVDFFSFHLYVNFQSS